MLSTLLSQIGTYFSKYFIIGSFLPVLAFTALNGIIAYFLFAEWEKWVDDNLFASGISRGAFFTTSFGVGIVIAAYVLSSLGTFLRQKLEGRGWGKAADFFIPAQNRRREHLIRRLQAAAMDIADLADAPRWEEDMREARKIGRTNHRGVAFRLPVPDPAVEERLHRLEVQRGKYNDIIVPEELRQLADQLAQRLSASDIDASPDVGRQQERLGRLIDYARERAHARHSRLHNELNSNFGIQELMATKMGNVANTIQSYAVRRYHCNFEMIWSNLQSLVQKDDKAQASLQESKTQLDFLVACCWLSLLSTVLWVVIFTALEPSRLGFLAAALVGPAVAYMWYRAAAEQYRSFADIAMTSLDGFRLDLLLDLRLGTPTDVEDERNIWENLDQLATYGESRNFRYQSPTHS